MERRPALLWLLTLAVLLSPTAGRASIRHNYHLKNVLWSLSFSFANRSISGDVTNTVTLLQDTPNVQLRCNDLKLLQVTVNGEKATYEHADGVLTVTLPKPGRAGQTLDIRTVYTGTPPNGIFFVEAQHAFPAKTDMVYTQGEPEDNCNWLPTYDYPDDKATTESFITVPKTWTAISNGRLVDVKDQGATRVFHWKLEQPTSTYLISLVAGEYAKVTDTWHKIPVEYYVPYGLEPEGKQAFHDTPKMIDLYSRLTGVDYPWPKFAQDVVSEFGLGGMENVTCVTLTIDVLHPPGSDPVGNSTGVIAHELAHQWFGDLVTCRNWDHLWLNEGFASFMPLFYDREAVGQEQYDYDRYSTYEDALNSMNMRGRKDVDGAVGSSGPNVNIGDIYPGGAARLLVLLHELGEDTFWRGIQGYLEKYRFGLATTDDFFQAMSKATGRDLNGFEAEWFHSPAPPSLHAKLENGTLVLSQLAPYYKLEVPIWFWTGQTWVKESLSLAGREARLPLADLAGKPFLVDPEAWIPMELTYDVTYSTEDVSALYQHAPNTAAKAKIIDEFFDKIPVETRTALGRGETFAMLIRKLIDHLGRAGVAFSIPLSQSHDEIVVDSAVNYLGRFAKSPGPEYEARLNEILKSDPNEIVRGHAVGALLRWTSDPSLATQAWNMPAYDDGFRRRALEWWAKHDPDQARTRALVVLAHPDNYAIERTALHVLGEVGDTPGGTRVLKTLMQYANEPTGSARGDAQEAIKQLDKHG